LFLLLFLISSAFSGVFDHGIESGVYFLYYDGSALVEYLDIGEILVSKSLEGCALLKTFLADQGDSFFDL